MDEGGLDPFLSVLPESLELSKLGRLTPRRLVVVRGEIIETARRRIGSSPAYRCLLFDGSGKLALYFLGRGEVAGLDVGTRCLAAGRVASFAGELVLWNPRYRIELGPPDPANTPQLP